MSVKNIILIQKGYERELNLKWPWNGESPPNDISVWKKCKKDFEEAVRLLLFSAYFKKEKDGWIRESRFLKSVIESMKPKDAITLEEYKNLTCEDVINVGDRRLFSDEYRKKDLEAIERGEKVEKVYFVELREKKEGNGELHLISELKVGKLLY